MPTTTLLFTGNGGPGIAAAAAAAALRAADMGHRTLLVGFGPIHSLGALLDAPLGGAPQEIAPRLDALALDAPRELNAAWEHGRTRLPSQLAAIAGDELPIPPGLEMFLGLQRLRDLAPHYALTVIDAGPHDTLLRLLALPDGMRWAVRLLFGLDRGPGRSAASVRGALLPTAFIPTDALDQIQELRVAAEQARALLTADGAAAVRYVLRPDRVALAEAQLAVPALQLHGLPVAALIGGPLLPDGVADVRLAPLISQQAALLAEARALWPGCPLRLFELPTGHGLAALRPVGEQTSETWEGITAPASAPIVEELEGAPALAIELPGMPKNALQITLSGDELIVRIGPYRRHILLPEGLRGASIRATREDDRLIVRRR
jgi:arsenite/tail-anchored protein-transporting ATPase